MIHLVLSIRILVPTKESASGSVKGQILLKSIRLIKIIRFMSVLFTDIQWKEQNLKLLQDLCKASTALEFSVHPNPLPSAEQGRLMFDN